MKHLFMLALALVMTCTFAFAQSQSPYSKGKYYGKQIINIAIQEDEDALDRLSTNVDSYIASNIETEDDLVNFINGLEAGIRESCKANGLSDDETDQVIEMMGHAILEGMLEESCASN